MQYPRVVRRGPTRSALWALIACVVAAAAPLRADATPREPTFPRLRILSGLRRVALPTGRWSLEQHSFGLGVELEPVDGLVLESLAEVSSTDLTARRLSVDPVEVKARLSLDRSWGFAHAARVRTHQWGPVRLEAFGEVRYMPGWESMRILELLLKLAGLDLGRMPDPGALAEARFAWWQAAAGVRLGVRSGPVDATLDAGALWARLALAYSLLERGRVLQDLVADGAQVDPDGHLVIEQRRPFGRLGIGVDLGAAVRVEASAAAVPTPRGLAHGLTLGMRWAPW